jgi:hypothetical protein
LRIPGLVFFPVRVLIYLFLQLGKKTKLWNAQKIGAAKRTGPLTELDKKRIWLISLLIKLPRILWHTPHLANPAIHLLLFSKSSFPK